MEEGEFLGSKVGGERRDNAGETSHESQIIGEPENLGPT